MPAVPAPGAESPDPVAQACLALNAAGLTLRRVRETGPAGWIPSPAALPAPLVLGAAERARVRAYAGTGWTGREAAAARERSVTLLHPYAPGYPALLAAIPDPPLCLYVDGDPAALTGPAVAVVGSRNASLYGRSVAEALGTQLALAGITVVSGFARGVDAAAHRAAVRAGGRTVAVLGCGLDVPYPRGHETLREEVRRSGCLVTEFPFGTRPTKGSFPQRNRVVSGLALGTVVVEANEISGALITARHALEQGREVFAVPGSVFTPSARGPHRLLRDGAKLVEHVDDILEEIAAHVPPPEEGRAQTAGALLTPGSVEAKVFAALGSDPVHVDELARTLALPMERLMPALSILELRRCVRQHAGKRFTRS